MVDVDNDAQKSQGIECCLEIVWSWKVLQKQKSSSDGGFSANLNPIQ